MAKANWLKIESSRAAITINPAAREPIIFLPETQSTVERKFLPHVRGSSVHVNLALLLSRSLMRFCSRAMFAKRRYVFSA
jgi:hypothetical protein